MVGALDLYLHRPRSSTAHAITRSGSGSGSALAGASGVVLLRLSRSKLAALAAEAPQALNLVQAVLMRAICRDLAVAMESAAQPGAD